MAGPARIEQMLDASAAAEPERAALIHGSHTWTYRELRAESERRAGVLIEAGLGAGDLVIVAEPVTADFTIAFLACCRAGGIFVTLSPLLADAELRELGERARPALALTPDGRTRAALAAPRALPLALPGTPSAATLDEVRRRATTGDPAAPAAIRGTSSTTGSRPKLVARSHAQLTQRRAVHADWDRPASVNSCYTPNQFMSGETCRVLGLGATLHLPGSTTPRGLEAEWAAHRIDVIYTVPALLGPLVEQAAPPPAGLRVALIRATAAVLPPALQEAAAGRYGGEIVAEYGMTECNAIMNARGRETPAGSIGRPFSGVEVRLLDDAGEPADDGEIGELVIRSPNVMLGYWGDPAATAAVLRDGWLQTGDLARRDREGYYFLVGRQQTRINVGGFKVAPEEVEAILLAHPGVCEAVAVAMPDTARGEVVRAIIVPATSPPPTDDELRRFCRARLAGYKVPRQFEFRDSLPRSALGKVLRRQL